MTLWTVAFERSAVRDLEKLDDVVRRRILRFLVERVAVLDNPESIASPLVGPMKGLWRWRVGDHRILGRLEGVRLVINVVEVGHRREVYR